MNKRKLERILPAIDRAKRRVRESERAGSAGMMYKQILSDLISQLEKLDQEDRRRVLNNRRIRLDKKLNF